MLVGVAVTPAIGISNYNDDTTPPVTTCTLDPPEPDGMNDWYVSDVNVTLNATDDLSGVNTTFYRINGEEWEIYESPFIIFEDGNYILIEYYSVDNAENVEDVKSACFKLDQTPPETSLKWRVWREGFKWHGIFSLNFTDETSGAIRIEIYYNDELQETITGYGPIIDFHFWWYNLKSLRLKFVVYDEAGNFAVESVNGSDIHSRSRINLLTQYSNNVWFLRFFNRFPLIQQVLGILGWYEE